MKKIELPPGSFSMNTCPWNTAQAPWRGHTWVFWLEDPDKGQKPASTARHMSEQAFRSGVSRFLPVGQI